MFLVLLLLLASPIIADEFSIYPWELIGAEDDLLNGICMSGNSLYATTEEGFYSYNSQTGVWDDHTNPGWIGMAKYAVVEGQIYDDRLVTGGVNAWFKGTLFYSDDMGDTETLVYESNGGRVTDMAYSLWDDPAIYACTLSDIVDGELLRSNDDGQSWSLITGHGHHAMTSLAVLGHDEVFVAGDNYITHTTDGGQTWENMKHNLPDNQGIYCMHVQGPVTALPYVNYVTLMVSNDTGLYYFDSNEEQWELILPYSCKSIAQRFVQYDTFIFWTETYAVTWDDRVLFCLGMDFENWQDVTEGLPAAPIDIEAGGGGVYVALQGGGVYQSCGYDYPSSVPSISTISLSAFPNPFNPATTIKFEIATSGHALIQAFDLQGALVATITDSYYEEGEHTKSWQPQQLSSGNYMVVLKSGGQTVGELISLVR